MGETAAETRHEIAELRDEMAGHVEELRVAARRQARAARAVAIAAAGIAGAAVVALVVIRVRAGREERSLAGKIAGLRHAPDAVRGRLEKERARLRQELRQELAKELSDARPLHEKLLTSFADKAATAATPVAIKKLEELATRG